MYRVMFRGLALLFLAGLVCAEEQTHFMLRTAYCACRCCEKGKDCFRHDSIPATFKCSESNCNKKFCDAWNSAKCAKDCFCERCKGKIDKDDYRCIAHTKVPETCDCAKQDLLSCDHKQPDMEEMNKGIKSVSSLASNLHCVMPCFCRNCKDSLPPQMYGDCMMTDAPGEECKCDELGCPSKETLEGLRKVQAMREQKKKGNSSAFEFSNQIDEMMTPGKAKEFKCKLQCFCEVCGKDSEKIHDSCEKMLPKPRLENCECNQQDISCPSEDLDQQCKLYCFCKGCKDDPRMTSAFLKSCEEMTKEEKDCMCADKEDCNVLDNVPPPTDKEQKEKPKKGKLKKKKPDRVEL